MLVYNNSYFNIEKRTAVTLGNFDGIHLGHQVLINTVTEYARNKGVTSVMFSFYPHPVVFFGKNKGSHTMLSPEEKVLAAEKTGVDVLIQYPFDREFASLSPQEFMDILLEKTNCEMLVVGENYNFGKNRAGNIETLKALGHERGIRVLGIKPIEVDGERVSSTRIRSLIGEGNMEEVARLLNKPYFVMGEVVHGDKRGRQMNFPTINLLPPDNKLLPPNGAYLSTVIYNGKEYYSMSNIGFNPTFNGMQKKIETHIFNFEKGEIYGENVVVCLYKRIRGEVKFNGMQELACQLEMDKKQAREYIRTLDVLSLSL